MKDHTIIPTRAGVGLKAQHYLDILGDRPDIGWFEIHAENYMGDGGPPHHYLSRIRENWPISLHGVGLSIGGHQPLDKEHLGRLKTLNERYRPGLFSEHLAWSSHDGRYINDLLPLPYTDETLNTVGEHIEQVQDCMGRPMLLENPSTYLTFETSTMSELDFLKALTLRTGCGLLLDINNVFVSATNQGYSPEAYIDGFPLDRVGEIHLGGHAEDADDKGKRLLIDAHDRAIADSVWALYAKAIDHLGPVPTLVEWDDAVPEWPILAEEAYAADRIMTARHKGQRLAAD